MTVYHEPFISNCGGKIKFTDELQMARTSLSEVTSDKGTRASSRAHVIQACGVAADKHCYYCCCSSCFYEGTPCAGTLSSPATLEGVSQLKRLINECVRTLSDRRQIPLHCVDVDEIHVEIGSYFSA